MNLIKKLAYSKINLGLQVLNLRDDGYHNINTVFYLINLYDEIDFYKSDVIEIETSPDLNIPIEKNLVYKAGKAFLDSYKIRGGFKAAVSKNIPSGGGLGGGSSDAATTIIALNNMYGIDGAYSNLLEIANSVGSDCAFFLSGERMAKAYGRGEIIEPIHHNLNCNIAVINTGLNISTPEAYKLLLRSKNNYDEIDFVSIIEKYHSEPSHFKGKITNDFEDVVFDMHPSIGKIKDKLYEIGADFALMSGSGSTVFGLFTRDIELNELQSAFPKYFCFLS